MVNIGSIVLAKPRAPDGDLEAIWQRLFDFLLARRTLGQASVVNLLLSSSFGVNALLYAAWLGYTIGAWALVIQAAWAASFLLLIPRATKFSNINSLHDLLGQQFGPATKRVAALCSLIGISYFIGWEVGIGRETIESLLVFSEATEREASLFSNNIIAAIVAISVAYTFLRGLKGNATIDTYLNIVKLVVLIPLVFLLVFNLYVLAGSGLISALFPRLDVAIGKLGLIGLITNVLFNLSWQFVDNSSWQSIIAGSRSNPQQTVRNLKFSAAIIFLTIGTLGTLLGASLSNMPGISPDNILISSVQTISQYQWVFSAALAILVVACVMSLVDGMLLASALTIVVDLGGKLRSTSVLGKNGAIIAAKGVIIIVAIFSVWGIPAIIEAFGANLFDFVYIVILTQLALIGPVLFGFRRRRSDGFMPMWIAIAAGLLVGFGTAIVGAATGESYLIDSAGTMAMIASLGTASLVSWTHSDRTMNG